MKTHENMTIEVGPGGNDKGFTTKILAATNAMPVLDQTTFALRRRVVIVPWEFGETLELLYRSELERVGSETRARTASFAAWDYMHEAIADFDRRLPTTTASRRRESLRAAGLCDIDDPRRLAEVAHDLGIKDENGLLRLVRLLNKGGAGSLERVAVQYLSLVTRAYHELEQMKVESVAHSADLTEGGDIA